MNVEYHRRTLVSAANGGPPRSICKSCHHMNEFHAVRKKLQDIQRSIFQGIRSLQEMEQPAVSTISELIPLVQQELCPECRSQVELHFIILYQIFGNESDDKSLSKRVMSEIVSSMPVSFENHLRLDKNINVLRFKEFIGCVLRPLRVSSYDHIGEFILSLIERMFEKIAKILVPETTHSISEGITTSYCGYLISILEELDNPIGFKVEKTLEVPEILSSLIESVDDAKVLIYHNCPLLHGKLFEMTKLCHRLREKFLDVLEKEPLSSYRTRSKRIHRSGIAFDSREPQSKRANLSNQVKETIWLD